MTRGDYWFVVCQRGAEAALKQDALRLQPGFRFAFSRPGFVTFKLPSGHDLAEDFQLDSPFARTQGFSLGSIRGERAEAMADQLWQRFAPSDIEHLHVWQRDVALPGEGDFEPGVSVLARQVARRIAGQRPAAVFPDRALPVNLVARSGQRILDCALVTPDEWWIGYHRSSRLPSRWPGGTPKIDLPPEAVSRAYLKMVEALLWSRLPITRGDRCVELGSAPGGSCQALLDRGLHVTGIDPAEMEPLLLEHPHFTPIRARAADLKRREFRAFKWLFADSNVAPGHTLDSVESIVTHRQVQVQGLVLTLKLLQWDLAARLPEYLERIRSWGYPRVQARQLAFNRQEVCVCALRHRPRRRLAAEKNRLV